MKNFLRITAVVVAILGFTCARAAKKVEVHVDQSSGKLNISLKNVSVGEYLTIKDFSGVSLYKKTFKEMSNFEKTFSLGGQDNGMYFVELESATEIQITPVLKNDQGVTLLKNAEKFVFKPQYSKEGDVFHFSLFNNNQDDVQITMYASNGATVVAEGLVNDMMIKRNYNTKDLSAGEYRLVVKEGKKTFSKSFTVQH